MKSANGNELDVSPGAATLCGEAAYLYVFVSVDPAGRFNCGECVRVTPWHPPSLDRCDAFATIEKLTWGSHG